MIHIDVYSYEVQEGGGGLIRQSHIYGVAIIMHGSQLGDSCTQPGSTGSVFFKRHSCWKWEHFEQF